MDGKGMARLMDALDVAARQLRVRPLSEFFSMAPEDVAEFTEGADDIELPPLQQFSAQEGLTTVRALLPQKHPEHVVEDLRQCERILSTAAQHGVGWHFEIDI